MDWSQHRSTSPTLESRSPIALSLGETHNYTYRRSHAWRRWVVGGAGFIRGFIFSMNTRRDNGVTVNDRDCLVNPYNAEIFLYKSWRPKGFFILKLS